MLEDIKTNIEKLIARLESEREENASLRAQIEEIRSANESCQKHITELEQEIETLKLSEAFKTPGNGGAAGARIEKLIKEIDKCISMLEA
ncbi:MAG: hypothetical protein IK143_05720 [Bacteroidales bacterium]|nr:hypothetical protein [Bacteroidales bacterium]